ncbi:MAG: hypothetical protein HPY52_10930 [Firmicutes bacterium]|nr:hypothetical protein [Bacillota bacterium]
MAMQVDREVIDDFCPRLFRLLDNLDLLPRRLSAKPNEFEKYPRLLFGCIQRYNDVEAGFKEWESRILRETAYKDEYYLEIEALRQWMLAHGEAFAKKSNIQHLSTSLYARLFQYLYPRRVLANAYCLKHRGEPEVLSRFKRFVDARDGETRQAAKVELEQLLDTDFQQSVEPAVANLMTAYADDWKTIINDVKRNVMAGARYYHKVLTGEQAPVSSEAGAQIENYEKAEEE